MGLLDAAIWAAIVVISKRLLRVIAPVVLNFVVRVLARTFMVVSGVPLTATHSWSLDFDLTWAVFGYMSLMAFVTWIIAFNAYYYSLRHGQVSVVGPISSSDPVFTALFSFVVLGATFGGFMIAGLVLTVAGVLLIARWMGSETGDVEEPAGSELVLPAQPTGTETARPLRSAGTQMAAQAAGAQATAQPAGAEAAGAPVLTGTAAGPPGALAAPADGVPETGAQVVAGPATDGVRPTMGNVQIVGLALLCAAAWGLAPIIIQAAMDQVGGPSLWMLMLSQGLGALFLAPLVWRRRGRITIRPVTPRERRILGWLLLVSGLLEALFSILFYFVIDAVGAVLTTITVAASPVFTILAGILFLRERPSAKLLFAAAVTLCGVFLATIDRL